MPAKQVALISRHGEFWKRDGKNFDKLENDCQNPSGVYALYNGMTPVYFGQGQIASRLRTHNRSRHRKWYWDHFSWYEIEQKDVLKDLETLFLRMLPVYLHMLNRQRGSFVNSKKKKDNHSCELIKPKYGVGSKHRRKKQHK